MTNAALLARCPMPVPSFDDDGELRKKRFVAFNPLSAGNRIATVPGSSISATNGTENQWSNSTEVIPTANTATILDSPLILPNGTKVPFDVVVDLLAKATANETLA